MNATSIRTGTTRAGTITVTLGAAAYGFAYHRGTGKARHDLTVYPTAEPFAVGLLGEAVWDLAVRTAEALDDGPHEWTVTIDATGVTVRAARDLGDETGAYGSRAAWSVAS